MMKAFDGTSMTFMPEAVLLLLYLSAIRLLEWLS
jgi:hypothetical protein